MKHYINAGLARSPWCAAGGKVVAWLSAWGCRHGVGRCSMREHHGLQAMPVAPSHCASSTGAEQVVPRPLLVQFKAKVGFY